MPQWQPWVSCSATICLRQGLSCSLSCYFRLADPGASEWMVDNCLIFVSYLPGRGVLGSQPFVVLCYTVWHLPGFWGIQIWVIRLEWQVLYASPVMPKPTLASRFFFFLWVLQITLMFLGLEGKSFIDRAISVAPNVQYNYPEKISLPGRWVHFFMQRTSAKVCSSQLSSHFL